MRKVKCDNGHFFDCDRFPVCPICGSNVAESVPAKIENPIEQAPSKTMPLLQSEEISTGTSVLNNKRVDELAPTEMITQSDEAGAEIPPQSTSIPSQTLQRVEVTAELASKPLQSSLRDAVAATSSTEQSALPKTVAYYDFDATVPPVAWLVCIKGPHLGTAFECFAGKNRIGRNMDSEIKLISDATVSRDSHAFVIYEPKHRQFFIQEGAGMTYLNDDLLYGREKIVAYDKIMVGNTEFVFFPLCGENFTWDDYMSEEGATK